MTTLISLQSPDFVLTPYRRYSSDAVSSLISLSSISHISTHSQPSILPLFNLLFQFPSLINSNLFPSYSSFSSYGWRSITRSSSTHPGSLSMSDVVTPEEWRKHIHESRWCPARGNREELSGTSQMRHSTEACEKRKWGARGDNAGIGDTRGGGGIAK